MTAELQTSTPIAAAFTEPETDALLRTISELALDLADVGDREALLATMLRRARELLGADMAYVSLNDLTAGETYIHCTDGVRTPQYASIRMPFGTGVLGAAAAGGRSVHTVDYIADTRLIHLAGIDETVRGEGVRAIAGAPMRVGGRVVGAFLIAHREPRDIGPRAREALAQLAVHAAVALDQARRRDEIASLRGELDRRSDASTVELRHLEQLVRLDERLMGVMVAESNDVSTVFAVLEEALDAPVALYDDDRLVLGVDVARAADRRSWWMRSAVDTSRTGGGAARARLGDEEYAVMAVLAAGAHLGTLVVRDTSAATLATLAHAAPFIAVMQLLGRTEAVEGELEQRSLLEEVVDARSAVRPATLARLHALGLAFDAPISVLVLDASSVRDDVPRLVRSALGGRGAVVSGHDAHLCVLVNDEAREAAAALASTLETEGVRVVVGAAHAASGVVRDVRRAHDEATELAAAARALGWTSGLADLAGVGVVGALVQDRGGAMARAIVDRAIGPVIAYDAERGTELVETLHRYFDAGGSAHAASSVMHLHVNTLRQRLERVDALLGRSWRSPQQRLRVQLAVQLWRVSRGSLATGDAD